MEFNDLKTQYGLIEFTLDDRIKNVFYHGRFINGPEVGQLEQLLADYVGVEHAVACGSGTDALLLALMALEIGEGDAVFTSAFSFVAAAEMIKFVGATPIFVDINPYILNMSIDNLASEINRVNKSKYLKARAIIPVNLFGMPCDYDPINRLAMENEMIVIEDMAQSFGATYIDIAKKTRNSGALSQIACTSFFPSKPLGCYGDGGMIFTDNLNLAKVVRALGAHGSYEKYKNMSVGINSRLDTIQAAILLEKFDRFPHELVLRRANWHLMKTKISNANPLFEIPSIDPFISACAQFPVVCRDPETRQKAIAGLGKKSIPYQIYYPTSLPDLAPYKSEPCPIARDIASRIMALPFSPYMTVEDMDHIAEALKG